MIKCLMRQMNFCFSSSLTIKKLGPKQHWCQICLIKISTPVHIIYTYINSYEQKYQKIQLRLIFLHFLCKFPRWVFPCVQQLSDFRKLAYLYIKNLTKLSSHIFDLWNLDTGTFCKHFFFMTNIPGLCTKSSSATLHLVPWHI